MSKPPIKMNYLIILILTITITGETMSHVKGHFDVPAQQTNKNEVKNSFFNSFKKKRIQIGNVEVGGIYGKKPDFSSIRKLFKKN